MGMYSLYLVFLLDEELDARKAADQQMANLAGGQRQNQRGRQRRSLIDAQIDVE